MASDEVHARSKASLSRTLRSFLNQTRAKPAAAAPWLFFTPVLVYLLNTRSDAASGSPASNPGTREAAGDAELEASVLMAAPRRCRRSDFGEDACRTVQSREGKVVAAVTAAEMVIRPTAAVLAGARRERWKMYK